MNTKKPGVEKTPGFFIWGVLGASGLARLDPSRDGEFHADVNVIGVLQQGLCWLRRFFPIWPSIYRTASLILLRVFCGLQAVSSICWSFAPKPECQSTRYSIG